MPRFAKPHMLLMYIASNAWFTAEALKLGVAEGSKVFDPRQEVHILADFNADWSFLRTADPEAVYGSEHRAAVLEGCGELCDFQIKGTPGKYFNEIRKKVDCEGLYRNTLNDAPAAVWPPPNEIPAAMYADYTLDGNATVESWYFEQRYSGGNMTDNVWTEKDVNAQMALAGEGKLEGSYSVSTTARLYQFIQKHASNIRGKRLFVIGSERPWVEALLLNLGAEHVTTIEYGKIRSEHPRITAVTPDEIRRTFLASGGREPQFDGGVTFSSIEHSGLGRYGDTLNPWGDIQTVAKAWCITKDHGSMFVGVPSRETDFITWNAHRQYGPLRWAQLMANWQQIDREEGTAHSTYSAGFTYMFEKMPGNQQSTK